LLRPVVRVRVRVRVTVTVRVRVRVRVMVRVISLQRVEPCFHLPLTGTGLSFERRQ
jgi:hypothetical protein